MFMVKPTFCLSLEVPGWVVIPRGGRLQEVQIRGFWFCTAVGWFHWRRADPGGANHPAKQAAVSGPAVDVSISAILHHGCGLHHIRRPTTYVALITALALLV